MKETRTPYKLITLTLLLAILMNQAQAQNDVLPLKVANSCDMVMLRVRGTSGWMCTTDTRNSEYALFMQATGYELKTAPSPHHPDHPVVHVSRDDASAYCHWLTAKERSEGTLSKDFAYRLPTDAEWSLAADLRESHGTPKTLSLKVDDYSWGDSFPPRENDGNFNVVGIDDGYEESAPVASYPANDRGLYDMGGNVREWCNDWMDFSRSTAVLRDASWKDGRHGSYALNLSRRSSRPVTSQSDTVGFRIFLAPANTREAAPVHTNNPMRNSIGCNLIEIFEGGPLLANSEISRDQWKQYLRETRAPDNVPESKFRRRTPITNISWNEAKTFCDWLTSKEQLAGIIGPRDRYRLPSKHEWYQICPIEFVVATPSTIQKKYINSKGFAQNRPNLVEWLEHHGPDADLVNLGVGLTTLPYIDTRKIIDPKPALVRHNTPPPARRITCNPILVLLTFGLIGCHEQESNASYQRRLNDHYTKMRERESINNQRIRSWQKLNWRNLYYERMSTARRAVPALQDLSVKKDTVHSNLGFRVLLERDAIF